MQAKFKQSCVLGRHFSKWQQMSLCGFCKVGLRSYCSDERRLKYLKAKEKKSSTRFYKLPPINSNVKRKTLYQQRVYAVSDVTSFPRDVANLITFLAGKPPNKPRTVKNPRPRFCRYCRTHGYHVSHTVIMRGYG